METISLKPNLKLVTKIYYVFLSISILLFLSALIIQFTVPLGKHVNHTDVAVILWPIWSGIILLFWLIGVPITQLWVKNLEYLIANERIILKKGILSKIEQNIPFYAITDFILHRSLYDRFLGIASIRIQTAGQSSTPTGYEANLAGLTEWNNLMDSLSDRLKKSGGIKSTTSAELVDSESELNLILDELREIKDILRERS
ncbi:MAG: PH domain-containing protein [Bacteroidetes bacterium]|nr:PH domain-containing protein [Bacteroidota bacterium]